MIVFVGAWHPSALSEILSYARDSLGLQTSPDDGYQLYVAKTSDDSFDLVNEINEIKN